MRVSRMVPLVAICALSALGGRVDSVSAAQQALVRVAYVSPDAANADVYFDAGRTLSDVSYKTVSSYMALTPGSQTVTVRPAGASASATPWAQLSQVFSAGADYTVVVGGRFGQLQMAAFEDQFGSPGAGQAEARFIHMAPDVPAVDVVVQGGPVIFSNISFLQASNYRALPSGTYNLQLRATGTSQVLFTATDVVIAAGSIHSETGIGGVGSPVELLQIPDAGSAANAPIGGANTGGGGLAVRASSTSDLVAPGALGVVALLLLLVTGIRRLSGRRR